MKLYTFGFILCFGTLAIADMSTVDESRLHGLLKDAKEQIVKLDQSKGCRSCKKDFGRLVQTMDQALDLLNQVPKSTYEFSAHNDFTHYADMPSSACYQAKEIAEQQAIMRCQQIEKIDCEVISLVQTEVRLVRVEERQFGFAAKYSCSYLASARRK